MIFINRQKGVKKGLFWGSNLRFWTPKKGGVQKPVPNTGRIVGWGLDPKNGQNRQKWAFFKKNHWCLVDF